MQTLFNKLVSSSIISYSIIIVIALAVIVVLFLILKKYKLIGKLKFLFVPNPYYSVFRYFLKKLDYKIKYSIDSKKQYLVLNSTTYNIISQKEEVNKFRYNHYSAVKSTSNLKFYLTKNLFFTEFSKELLILLNKKEEKIIVKKFLKKLYKYTQPTILIYIDYFDAINFNPQEVIQNTLYLRDTLNTIHNSIGSCPVFIGISGFSKLSGISLIADFFTHINEKYLVINDNPKLLTKELQMVNNRALDNLGHYVNNIRTANNFIDIIEMINLLNKVNESLDDYLDKLSINDDIITPPAIKGVYYDFSKRLDLIDSLKNIQKINYSQRNIIVSLAGLAAIFLIFNSFYISNQFISKAVSEVSSINSKSSTSEPLIKNNINNIKEQLRVLNQLKHEIDNNTSCCIYSNDRQLQVLRRKIAENIYNKILYVESVYTKNPAKLAISLFISQSSANNNLKDYLKKNSAKLALALNVDKKIIDFYLKYNVSKNEMKLIGTPVYIDIKKQGNIDVQMSSIANQFLSLTKNDHVTVKDLNMFLKSYYDIYNRDILMATLLSKFYPKVKGTFSKSAVSFLDTYFQQINPTRIDSSSFKVFNELANIIGNTPMLVNDNKVSNSFGDLINSIYVNLENYKNKDFYKYKKIIVVRGKKVSPAKWLKIITQAKINSLINEFFFKYTAVSSCLFADNITDSMNSITLNDSNNGNSLIGGKYSIPALYTKNAIDSIILPYLKRFNSVISDLEDSSIKTDLLQNENKTLIDRYNKQYIKYYTNLLTAVKYNIASQNDLPLLINILSSSQSPVNYVLNIIYKNTNFSTDADMAYFKSINNSFQSINTLLKGKDKSDKSDNKTSITEITQFGLYSQLIQKMSLSLDNSRNSKTFLEHFVKDIATEDKNSYLIQLEKWLDDASIPENQRAIFIKPITSIYNYGLPILKEHLQYIWDTKMQPIINNTNRYFPFDKTSELTISEGELMDTFSNTGSFWTLYNKYFAPFFVKTDDNITLKNTDILNSVIPDKIFEEIRKVYKLKNSLWDKSGKAKELNFTIKSTLLPESGCYENNLVKISSLASGKGSIININTPPVWHTLNSSWNNSNSSVNIGFEDGSSFNIDNSQANFSFLRLIQQGEFNSNDNTVKWTVLTPEKTNFGKVYLIYHFSNNPFELFDLL